MERDVLEVLIASFVATDLIGDPDVVVDVERNLLADGSLDSVSVMRLVLHLEATFGMKIPPTDLVPEHFRTIRLMATYLVEHGAKAPP